MCGYGRVYLVVTRLPSCHYLKNLVAVAPGVLLPRVPTKHMGFLSQWAPAITSTVGVSGGASAACLVGTRGQVFVKKHCFPRRLHTYLR